MIRTQTTPRELNPWPCALEIACGGPAELARFCSRLGLEVLDEDDAGSCHLIQDPKTQCVTAYVLVARDQPHETRIRVLTHEAVHVAQRIIGERAGMPLTSETQEAYAYFVEWIVRRGLKVIR